MAQTVSQVMFRRQEFSTGHMISTVVAATHFVLQQKPDDGHYRPKHVVSYQNITSFLITLMCVIPVVCVTRWERERIVKTTQLIRKKGIYSNMYKLHVSANSGHHQVFYRFKRKSYIWVGVLIKRSLVSIFLVISGVVTVTSTRTIS